MFNRHSHGLYKADIVVLVAVRSPKEYRCIVMPTRFSHRIVDWCPIRLIDNFEYRIEGEAQGFV